MYGCGVDILMKTRCGCYAEGLVGGAREWGRGFERSGPTRALQRDTESASSEGAGVDLTVGLGLLSGASQISSSSKD